MTVYKEEEDGFMDGLRAALFAYWRVPEDMPTRLSDSSRASCERQALAMCYFFLSVH